MKVCSLGHIVFYSGIKRQKEEAEMKKIFEEKKTEEKGQSGFLE